MATPSLIRQALGALGTRMVGWSAGLPQPQDPLTTGILPGKGMQSGSGVIPLRGEAPTVYQRTGTVVRIHGFERHPVVMACIRAIVDIAAAVPLQAYTLGPIVNGREDIVILPKNHPANQLVNAPSSFLSSMRLRELRFVHYLTYGNALTFLERPPMRDPMAPNTNPPTGIRVIHPEDLYSVYVNDQGYPIWYMWQDILGYPHTSPVTDIVHFRDLAAKGLVFGYPRAASAINDILGDTEASQYVREVVTNHGQPMGYALTEPGTSPEDAGAAEAALYTKLVERGQRGRFLFLGGVTDVKSIGFNLRDLEFPDLRRVSREDICASFGVDPRMVGITSASRDAGLSGTQYTEARKRLVQQTVEPMMRADESELNMWLAPEFGNVYYRYDPDSLRALVEDDTETSKRVVSEVAASVLTIEEAREALDYPAEFRPGDTLAIPSMTQIVPVAIALAGPIDPTTGEPIKGLPAPTGAATVDPKDAGTTSEPDATKEPPLANSIGLDPNAPGNPPKVTDGKTVPAPKRAVARISGPVFARGIVLSKDQRVMLWSAFDARAVADEAPYKRTARVLFNEERHNVSRIFESLSADPAHDVNAQAKLAQRKLHQMYKKGGEVRARWADKFHPLIGSTYAKGAEHLSSSTRAIRAAKKGNTQTGADEVTFDFHLTDPNVQQAIRDRAERLSDYVGTTTGDAVSSALSIGMREGMSMSEIARLIDQTAFGLSASARSNMIARTESIGSLNQGQFDAAVATGEVAGKEWLTQGDDRVRDSHAECEGEGMIGIDEKFSNGLRHPGDQDGDAEEICNCRCTLLYYDTLA